MITYVVQGEATGSKPYKEVFEWAKKLTRHAKSLDKNGAGPRLMTERFGNRHRIYFVQNFASLAELDAYQQTLKNDATYQKLIGERSWSKGTIKDKVLVIHDID